MKLSEVSLEIVQRGTNFLVSPKRDDWSHEIIERESELTPTTTFTPQDHVVYSSLCVRPSGRVIATLEFKQVGDFGPSGIYWEFEDGRWRRVGEELDPDFEMGTESYVADPLPIDPYFGDPESREDQRNGFVRHAYALGSGSRQ